MRTVCKLGTEVINLHFLTISSWFVVGQIFASVALQKLSANDPYDFRVPIYTQVRHIFISCGLLTEEVTKSACLTSGLWWV
jgi:hypothetical protein